MLVRAFLGMLRYLDDICDGHGEDLVNVIKDVAVDPSEREAIRFGTLLALNLRSAFWDSMLARAFAMETHQQLAPAA